MTGPDAPEVVVYVGSGCHLCEDATAMLDRLGVPYRTVSDPQYRERIPVITVNGAIVTEGRVSPRAVQAAVRRARRARAR